MNAVPHSLRYMLLLEDQGPHVGALRSALRTQDLRSSVRIATDVPAALQLLSAQSSQTAAAIILSCRGVHGLELLRALKASPLAQPVPVVALVRTAGEALVGQLYDAGASSVVRAFELDDDYFRKLECLVRFWARTNRPPLLS